MFNVVFANATEQTTEQVVQQTTVKSPQADLAKKLNLIAATILEEVVATDADLQEGTEFKVNEDLDLTDVLNLEVVAKVKVAKTAWSEESSALALKVKAVESTQSADEVVFDLSGEISLNTAAVKFYKFLAQKTLEDARDSSTYTDEEEKQKQRVLKILTNIVDKVETVEELFVELKSLKEVIDEEVAKSDDDSFKDIVATFELSKDKSTITLNVNLKDNERYEMEEGVSIGLDKLEIGITKDNTYVVLAVQIFAHPMYAQMGKGAILEFLPIVEGTVNQYGKDPVSTEIINQTVKAYIEFAKEIILAAEENK